MEELIRKSFSEIKDVDDAQGIIKGYANVYNIKDSDGDISLLVLLPKPLPSVVIR